MKRKFTFTSNKGARRSLGQTVAVTVMALAIAVSGLGTTALYISQPSGLSVAAPASQSSAPELYYAADEPAGGADAAPDEETSPAAPEAEADSAAGGETESASQPQQTETAAEAPAESTESAASEPETETGATGSGNHKLQKVDVTEGDIEEDNASYARFVPETPELAAEDPLSAPGTADAASVAERAAQAIEDNPLLLTPEQITQALEEGVLSSDAEVQSLDVAGENCLDWLWQWLFGSSGAKYSGWRTEGGNTYYYDPTTHTALTGIHTIDGVLYYFDANGVKQDVTFGIDVSKYQTGINWQQVKSSGVEFVIIRIGYRGYTTGTLVLDPMFEEHFTNARNAGLRVGAYAFSQAVNENEAREEALACVYVLNGRSLDYPLYFDTEASGSSNGTGRADGLSAADRTKCAIAFCEEVKANGYTPGVYASTQWFTKRLDMSQLTGYSIWNAHYNVAQSGVSCDIWQGVCDGKVNGYSGGIDVNVSFVG